ncbi:MAG: hypothetical protein HY874_01070 [Chloroflexi bacterium]|nr:hypothetical protein [Chloroflexota bacterium]
MKALFVLAAVVLAAGSVACGEFLTSAELTQTAAGPPAAVDASTETAAPATSIATAPTVDTRRIRPTPPPFSSLHGTPTSTDPMYASGSVWVDARPASGDVRAFINGKECGSGQSVRMNSEPPDPVPFLVVGIASDEQEPGCGVPGAAIVITLDGRPMNDTVEWQRGLEWRVTLVAGPAFARYSGSLLFPETEWETRAPRGVKAYVEGVDCGAQIKGTFVPELGEHPPGPPEWAYDVVVDPVELRAGCGQAGAEVSLRLEVDGQPDIDLGSVPWQTGSTVERPTIDLTALDPAP